MKIRSSRPVRWLVDPIAVALAAGWFLAPAGQAATPQAWVLKWSPQANNTYLLLTNMKALQSH